MWTRSMIAALALTMMVGLTGCSDDPADPGGGGTPATVSGTWYIDNAQIDFKSGGSYSTAMRVDGAWVSDETGTWAYNEGTKILTATVLVDNNGSWGLGDGPGSTLAVPVISVTRTSLVLDAGGELVTLSSKGPAAPGGTIRDSFDGSSFNPTLWYLDADDGTGAAVAGGVADLYAQGSGNSVRAKLELNAGGFRSVQAAVRVDEIVHGSGGSSGDLGWYPYGEDYVYLGLQAAPDNSLHITAGYGSGYTIVAAAQFGVAYTLKMVWTGSKLEFYVDGNLVRTQTPAPGAIIFSNSHPPKLKAFASQGGFVRMKADDFLAQF